jgi:rfaE bifunctional protein kinase chain/domain
MEKVVLVTGVFNVLHPGHLRLLNFAKQCGTKLIVAVLSDRLASNLAHVKEEVRLESLQSISWLDETLIYDVNSLDLIKRIKPNVIVMGKEHEKFRNEEDKELKKNGIEIIYSSGETKFSSQDLIKKETTNDKFQLPREYLTRHNISNSRIIDILSNFKNLKICVIGDLIIDDYINCQALGMSQEDSTVVVTPIEETRYLGGAGIVAAHTSGLGAKVTFISISGNDEVAFFAKNELKKNHITSNIIIDKIRQTTLKKRYRIKDKNVFRVSYLNQQNIDLNIQNLIYLKVKKIIKDINLLIFSDFNYGLLTSDLITKITELCKSNGVMTVADCQSSSQIGDITKFNEMKLITPTEYEARVASKNQDAGLIVLAEMIRKKTKSENIILKLGEDGIIVHTTKNKKTQFHTDRIPALNLFPKDVSGAGDSLLVASAMSLATGANIWESACIGSMAAALQVNRIGNTALNQSEIRESFQL